MTQHRGIRLICVDDEPSAIANCEYTFNIYGKMKSANFFLNPFNALEFVQNNPIDIAFLDIDMPEMNGHELADKLREQFPTLPIAFVTGNMSYLNPKNRKMAVPYLFKPCLDEEIFAVLDQVELCS